jgi:hypothetical protein
MSPTRETFEAMSTASITEGTFHQLALSSALLGFLHGLRDMDGGLPSSLTIRATLAPDGALVADLEVSNPGTGELWGATL